MRLYAICDETIAGPEHCRQGGNHDKQIGCKPLTMQSHPCYRHYDHQGVARPHILDQTTMKS
jgi:hypothetical protein